MPGTSTAIMLTHQVTYVEVEEKSDDDLTQCLVQLSTLPVVVREIFIIIFLPAQKIGFNINLSGLLWSWHRWEDSP